MLLFPVRSEAYAGPGAGFAVLSSFWTLLVAFLYSAYAFFTWPFRHLFRWLRHRKAYGKAQIKRAVILGFDGMDPDLADRFMREGRLPNLARLRDQGTFRKLRTTYPAISPVAWSTFMTGVNPGKHNIYDFLARDFATIYHFFPLPKSAHPSAVQNRQIHGAARQASDQGYAPRYTILALAGEGRDLLLGDPCTGDFSAREISWRAAFRHVRP